MVVGHVNGLRSKCSRQYSDCHLYVCSTQVVNSKDTVINSLCVKYKSSRGVVNKGMWVSVVQCGSGNNVSTTPSLPIDLCIWVCREYVSLCF